MGGAKHFRYIASPTHHVRVLQIRPSLQYFLPYFFLLFSVHSSTCSQPHESVEDDREQKQGRKYSSVKLVSLIFSILIPFAGDSCDDLIVHEYIEEKWPKYARNERTQDEGHPVAGHHHMSHPHHSLQDLGIDAVQESEAVVLKFSGEHDPAKHLVPIEFNILGFDLLQLLEILLWFDFMLAMGVRTTRVMSVSRAGVASVAVTMSRVHPVASLYLQIQQLNLCFCPIYKFGVNLSNSPIIVACSIRTETHLFYSKWTQSTNQKQFFQQ